MITLFSTLLNADSKAMNVNGSVTPKVFNYTATKPTKVMGIACVLKDDGSTTLDKFGALATLTNGLLISVTINQTTTDIITIKDNSDLCTGFYFNQFGSSAVLSILGIGTPQGFGNSTNVFVGFMEFNHPHFITLSENDSVSVTVRDNLTNIDIFNMSLKLCME